MSILFNKQYGSQYEIKFFGEPAPEAAAKLSLTGLFKTPVMQSVRLVVEADMANPWNKGIKVRESRDMAANLIRAARRQRT